MLDDKESGFITAKERYKRLNKNSFLYHSHFNIWTGIFVIISGGLLVAYGNGIESDFDRLLILFVGYIVSFLFHCSAKGFCYRISGFLNMIEYYKNTYAPEFFNSERKGAGDHNRDSSYINPIKGADISTPKIMALLSFFLTYVWGILFLTKFWGYIEKIYLFAPPTLCKSEPTCLCTKAIGLFLAIAIVFIINMLLFLFIKKFLKKELSLNLN